MNCYIHDFLPSKYYLETCYWCGNDWREDLVLIYCQNCYFCYRCLEIAHGYLCPDCYEKWLKNRSKFQK